MGISMKVLLFLVLFSIYCVGFIEGSLPSDSTLTFTLKMGLNMSGHNNLEIVFDNELPGSLRNWRSKMEMRDKGVSQVKGVFFAPPRRPSDYELFPGVGYYKFHPELAEGFDDATRRCGNEGGHLAIVNSEAEHQVLATLFARYPERVLEQSWAFVGFHDREKEGEYVTIFGQPLNTTGFTRWMPNNPDNRDGVENCGAVDRNGSLNDFRCNHNLPFICEYDLSWVENLV